MCWFFKKKPVPNEKKPLVFVHGIMGSFSPEILGKKGNWGFGIAAVVYNPFINNLKRLGYVPGQNLFICYYNWTKSSEKAAREFLLPKIDEALKKNPWCKKVDVMCHSMGGLVTRSYMQSDIYRNDIDKLIFIASPNQGALNAYYPWSGGGIAPGEGVMDALSTAALKGVLWLIKKQTGEKTNYDLIRKHMPAISELLPTEQLGSYLYCVDNREGKFFGRNIKSYVPMASMEARNAFLDKLNRGYKMENIKNSRVYNIIGEGHSTARYIHVQKPNPQDRIWKDGKPLSLDKVTSGDGTVLSVSAKGVEGKNYFTKGSHVGILKEGFGAIIDALEVELNNTDVLKMDQFIDVRDYISIILRGKYLLKLTTPTRENLLYNNIDNMLQTNLKDAVVVPLTEDLTWIFAPNPDQGDYRLEFNNRTRGNGEVFIDSLYGDGATLIPQGISATRTCAYSISITNKNQVKINIID
jgi:hypothetical protein